MFPIALATLGVNPAAFSNTAHPVDYAIWLASLGISIFPLNPSNKLPYSNRDVAAAIDILEPPKGDGGLKFATIDPVSIRAWWSRWPGALIGIRTGSASGLYVLDIDRKNGKDGFATVAANGWTIQPTVAVQTPSGGAHHFFRVPADNGYRWKTDAGVLGVGVDRKGDDGYVVWYGADLSQPMAEPPVWMLASGGRDIEPGRDLKPLGTDHAPSWNDATAALYSIDPDELDRSEWRNTTFAFRQSATGLGVPDDMVRLTWDGWCAQYHTNDKAENEKLWRSADNGTLVGWSHLHHKAYGKSPNIAALERAGQNPHELFGGVTHQLPAGASETPLPPNRTIDQLLTNAARLTPDNPDAITTLCRKAGALPPIHRDTVLNAIRTSTGMRIATLRAEALQTVNDTEPDHLALARMAIATVGVENVVYTENHFWIWEGRGVWNKREDIAIKKRVQATLEASNCSVTAAKVSGVTDVLRNEIYRPDHTFNTGNPDVVNCLNGELELTAAGWTLQPHRREHYRTTQIPVAYDPNASAPLFLAFLDDVFRDDADRDHKIWSLLELIGYTLMSHARHERFIMLIGGGANGKSVLLSMIEALAGMKNIAGVQPSKFDNIFQRAHLYQKLANIVTELKQGEIIADAELKAITSGELTTVEDKNGHPFEMRAFATCWFGTNHLPHTRDFSDALFRRATIITFNRTFSEPEQDHNLKTKLATELPGILNLALSSYARAIANGFTAPPSSIEGKRKWRLEADQVAQFVEEHCFADPTGMVAVDEVYRVFADWARRSGVRQIVGKQAMGDRLERLHFARKRSNGSWITGMKLRNG